MFLLDRFSALMLGMLLAASLFYSFRFVQAYRERRSGSLAWGAAVMIMVVLQTLFNLPELLFQAAPSMRWGSVVLLIDMLIMPLLCCMIFWLVRLKRYNLWPTIAILAPFVVMIILGLALPEAMLGTLLKVGFWMCGVYAVLTFLHGTCCAYLFDKRLKELYSDTEHRDLNWLYYLMGILMAMALFWCLVVPLNYTWMLPFFYMISIFVWHAMTYFILQHDDCLLVLEDVKDQKSEKEEDADDMMVRSVLFAEQLKKLEAEVTYFLTPGLTVNDVAAKVGTNRSYLSEYINKVRQQTFYDYINEIRVRHAAKLLMSGNARIEDVMAASGFSTMSTFRKAFSATYGCLPVEYKHRAKREKVEHMQQEVNAE